MDDKIGTLKNLRARMVEKEKVDISSLKIGDIIYMPLSENDGLTLNGAYKERNKFIVIVGFTHDGVAVGALLINSEIDPSKYTTELFKCQYPLLRRNYRNILRYDSWLDCSDIFEITKQKIEEKNGIIKGELLYDDMEYISSFLRDTDFFDNVTKQRYGFI